MYGKVIKRLLDFIVALISLILLSPVFLIVAILVRVNLGKPIFFRHQRPGKDEKIFTMYKFRSMTDDRDIDGNLLPDEIRLTRFGKFLRSTSLDELPELVNILKGDMSWIGPRPLMVSYLPYYSKEERQRHDVRPGLTGLAQINGRNTLTWEQRFDYELQYIREISLLNDVKIFFKTFAVALKREGTDIPHEEDFNVYREKQRER